MGWVRRTVSKDCLCNQALALLSLCRQPCAVIGIHLPLLTTNPIPDLYRQEEPHSLPANLLGDQLCRYIKGGRGSRHR